MKLQQIKIEEVFPHASNPRIISEAKFNQLVKSLQDFPEMANARPIIINKYNIVIGGNMRLKAMQKAGWITVPVIKVDWSEEKQREFLIKDNNNFGEWDWEILKSEFGSEQLIEFGLDLPAENFNPNLMPSFNSDSVTAEDMEKAKGNMSVGNGIAETLDVICPECGHEFHIKNS
ncbi:ParB N-terminal domain-containing protein [Flavobacterium sp. 25HG05S-40]|uniref:ParB N-terminal domain-containing protein n=1 Tax=Flavobacterium sp. 25HG05S-40 TaxID=3458682 RepID=UPI0040441862